MVGSNLRRRLISLLAALAVTVGVLAWPADGGAVVTCTGPAPTLTVFADEQTAILRSGNDIVVTGAGCAGFTVLNTDTIVVTGTLGPEEQLTIDQSVGGAFVPGLTAEGVGIAEIEFGLTGLDLSGGGALAIAGTNGDDTISLGALGVSLNTDDDVDVTLPAVLGPLRIFGAAGNDTIVATGGHGSGGPSPNRFLYLNGGEGNDVLDASDGDLGPGADHVEGGPGNDQLIGDPSADAVLYLHSPAGVTVHLDTVPRTATGEGDDVITGIDNVFGTEQDDVLFGHDLSNVLFGFGGDDEIHGGKSQDVIDGGAGNDQLYGEGGADDIAGGDGDDHLSEIFENGSQPQLSGGPGNDLYEISFGSAAGTITVNEQVGDDEIVVSCTPGKVTNTPSGTGAGTLSRGGESVLYAGVETITIPAECQTDPASPPQPPPNPTPGANSQQPTLSTSPPPSSTGIPDTTGPPQTSDASTLGAIIVAGTRRGRVLRLDASPSFLVVSGAPLDPLAWRWRLRGIVRTSAALASPAIVLQTRRTVRSLIEVHGSAGQLGGGAVRIHARVRRQFTLRVPEPTLASDSLRAAVATRAASIATRRELRVLPRALAAGRRVLSIVDVDGRTLAVRIRVNRPRSNRWLKRLERLSPNHLQQAAAGRRIVLARGARLTIVPARATSRLSLTFSKRYAR